MRMYLAGDQRAFHSLFARHAGRIFGYIVQATGSRSRAEDLTQQTWLRLHRARASFREGARFAPWLYTIAANLVRDSARQRARRGEELTADGAPPEPRTPDPDGTPGDGRHAEVHRALQALPEVYRDVILLHRWHDLGFVEIAQVLGTTEGAVKQRAHRGYLMLRELLRPQEPA